VVSLDVGAVFSPAVESAEEESVGAFFERLAVLRAGEGLAGAFGSDGVGGVSVDADELVPGDGSSPPFATGSVGAAVCSVISSGSVTAASAAGSAAEASGSPAGNSSAGGMYPGSPGLAVTDDGPP
jgi:hypothetical protein